jgi:hypothetical protein
MPKELVAIDAMRSGLAMASHEDFNAWHRSGMNVCKLKAMILRSRSRHCARMSATSMPIRELSPLIHPSPALGSATEIGAGTVAPAEARGPPHGGVVLLPTATARFAKC